MRSKFCSPHTKSINFPVAKKEVLPSEFQETSTLCDDFSRLILYSKTSATWARHKAAWSLIDEFTNMHFRTKPWPFTLQHSRAFATWALRDKGLKASTVKSYLYSLKLLHTLENTPCPDFVRDELTIMLLKGGEILNFLEKKPTRIRAAMSLSSLLILGHKLAENSWCDLSKQVVWTACVVSFFSSCRMGEILSPTENSFDPVSTLLWKHVTFVSPNNTTVFIPFTKTTGFKGEALELFNFPYAPCCPVAALSKLRSLSVSDKTWNLNTPVFTFKNGVFLTTARLNNILESYMSDFSAGGSVQVTCHSFRAAIPTLILTHPDKNQISDIKEWGRWSSDSYKFYSKLDKDKKKFLFNKIASLLSTSFIPE